MEHPNKERQSFLKNLDAAEHIVVAVYRLLLLLVIAAVVAVVVLVILRRPWGAGNQGEWFYFSVVVLLVLGWAVGQLVALDRQRRTRSLGTSLGSRTVRAARTWTFRSGSSAKEARRQYPGSGAP